MNIFLILSVCTVLLLVFLTMFLVPKKANNKNIRKMANKNFHETVSKSVDVSFLKIPKRIREMEPSLLYKDCKNLFDNFRVLKYNKKEKADLYLIEWNNWEVFMLIGLIKINKDMFISNPEEVLHPSISQLSKSELFREMNRIFLKYNKIDKDFTYDILRSQINWSAREVSVIFYYLSVYKNI